jgi:hypothetical protein
MESQLENERWNEPVHDPGIGSVNTQQVYLYEIIAF